MPKSYRIRTQPGVDKSIKIQLEQDFEYLEILSLKILQSDIYTRTCSDYGVVVGRVLVNGGFGVPNAKVSIFVPISEEDSLNPVISELYPYRNITDLNEDGYRYNLLPYKPSYTGHAATGTFPTRDDVLTNAALVEVYDKYYKYTVKTNESGDYMIFGVPTGVQTVFMDVDLSDIGCFSLTPQDLIIAGLATESQVNGNKFKSSTNLDELPQIKSLKQTIEVQPLWGEPEICLLGITRVDFDLTASANISIQPTAVFMGSLVSTTNEDSLKTNCKPKANTGNLCDLVAGPGQILSIRQTIDVDENGDPILEVYEFEEEGKVIDGDGTWLTNVPMNLDYITTNEFGEQVLSNDPKVGIPTKGKYRFKIKWQNETGQQNNFQRGNYLVPNIKEHGWTNLNSDPTNSSTQDISFNFPIGTTSVTIFGVQTGGLIFNGGTNNQENFQVLINGVPYVGDNGSIPISVASNVTILSNAIDVTQPQTILYTRYPIGYFNVIRSYAFSLDWDDYVDKQAAIDCEDTFYEFNYNKVYTVSSFIDRYKNGKNRSRHLGIKEITDRTCQSENNKFPVNDAVRNFDFLQFVVTVFLNILTIPFIVLLSIAHFIALTWPVFKWVLIIAIPTILLYLATLCVLTLINGFPAIGVMISNGIYAILYTTLAVLYSIYVIPQLLKVKKFTKFALPMISYPDCESCNCDVIEDTYDEITASSTIPPTDTNQSFLADIPISGLFLDDNNNQTPYYNDIQNDDPEILGDAITQYLQLFSGIDNTGSITRRGVGSFITKKEGGTDEYGYPLTEHWAQKMDSFNLRDKYFNGTNQIETSINGSLPIKDQVFVALVDWGVQDELLAGDVVSFQNPSMSGDLDRITGVTNGNQFNSFSITGTTFTGTTTVQMYYANPSDPTWSTNLSQTVTIIQNDNDGSYRYPADMEYFQVITGMTMSQYYSLNPNFNSVGLLPREYIQHRIRYRYKNYSGGYDNFEEQPAAGNYFNNFSEMGIIFFVRGVDPYTDRQNVEYNLTRLFGGALGVGTQIKVTGQYKINYPIRGYSNGKKPIEHNTFPYNNTPFINPVDRKLYGRSFTYVPNQTMMNSYPNLTSLLPYYYLSTDSNNSGLVDLSGNPYTPATTVTTLAPLNTSIVSPTTESIVNGSGYPCILLPFNNIRSNPAPVPPIGFGISLGSNSTPTDPNNTTLYSINPNPYYVGGGSFLMSTLQFIPYNMGGDCTNTVSNNFDQQRFWYLYSPSYRSYTGHPTIGGVNFSNPFGIVMRSDRLPTSTTLQGSNGNIQTLYALHQNNRFAYFRVPDEGFAVFTEFLNQTQVSDSTIQDLDISTGLTSSLTCENMVSLQCYEGYGTGFTINPNCSQTGKVEKGCYYLLNRNYVTELNNDIRLFLEWKARFNLMFAACRGVFGHVFQNNWINGVLYMPSFNKITTFNITGKARNRYCKDVIIYNDFSNSFFYRSSPWNGNYFIGSPKPVASIIFSTGTQTPDDSANNRQILFPTTILDMGKRDEFISEICGNSEFEGRYLANTYMSSSYNDTSDILQLGIISRLVNATWGQQLFQTGSASINQFFSRTGDRIDGDIAQSFSINSEYQINPFISGNYEDTKIYIGQDTTGPVFGVFFNATGVTNNSQYRNRRALSPGVNIYNFSPLLQQSFGYPSTQEVPLYRWKLASNSSIFGNEDNEWYTTLNVGGGFYTQEYQSLDPIGDDYFKTPLMTTNFPNIYYGFITNYNPSGNPVPTGPPILNPFLVGAPNHFYFGLKNGNTAMNKFIKKYVETIDD